MWTAFLAATGAQTSYLGPSVDLTIGNDVCSLDQPLTEPTATLKPEPHGVESVALNVCANSTLVSGSRRWQAANAPKQACSCRDDYAAFTVLPGRPTQNFCPTFEAAYSWLYGEPDPTVRLDWMTIFPRNNVTINVTLKGITFRDPDDDNRVRTCTGETIIQRSNRCFYGMDFNETLIPVNQNVLDTLTKYCNGSKTSLPPYVTSDCCVNATINNASSKGYVSRDIFFAASCDAVSRVSFPACPCATVIPERGGIQGTQQRGRSIP